MPHIRIPASVRFRISRWQHVAALAVPLVLACGSSDPSSFVPNLDDAYWSLELNHHAVLLSMTAPWDTLPLTVTPLNYQGKPLPGLAVPQYSSEDVKHVVVTPEGVLHAIEPLADGVEVMVTAQLTVNNVTHKDTVFVRVVETTNPPAALDAFSIHPMPPDTAKVASGQYLNFPTTPLLARSTDPNGVPIANVPISVRSSDNRIATVNRLTGVVEGIQPGTVNFYATTTVFGVAKADTLPYQIGWPVLGNIFVQRLQPSTVAFVPSEMMVGVGALVSWSEAGQDSLLIGTIDVNFADADLSNISDILSRFPVYEPFCHPNSFLVFECGSGNMVLGGSGPAPANGYHGYRIFTAPGIYEYHSSKFGISGRVMVIDER